MHYLIKAGADVNIVNSSGMTALNFADKAGNHRCADFLLRSGAGVKRTNTSVKNRPRKKVAFLLEKDEQGMREI